MENQKLPNATISLVLAILSLIGCCCTSGIGGVILSGIALFLTNKDEKTYAENPELYSNFSQVKTAKIIAIISLVLSVIILGIYIYLLSTGQYEEMMSQYMEMIEEMQQNQ
ncbi:CCC motif membrane protein [Winogradskyella sp. Asnod2-B02-A]|uniref:CCC motif membrane protein n=1 Tax=Winogradskyella sp. Asnod2-B02-A TaxID=3160583 RepID=UPI003870A435